MLDLSNVTLVTIDSAADHLSKNNIRLAAISRIVPKLLDKIKFGDLLIINLFGKNKDLLNEKFDTLWSYNFEQQPRNINWYSNFAVKKLPTLIKTEWYLIIQWDGFPDLRHCEETWDNRFFEFPFLGGGHSVYNGGFSLRNTKIMKDLSTIQETYDTGAEDGFYSSFFQNKYQKNKNTPIKLKWTEDDIVDKFCTFRNYNQTIPSFGWHRSNFLSDWAIKDMFKWADCFDVKEIDKLLQYCKSKDFPTHLFVNDYMKFFDMDFNEDFYNY